MTSRLSLTLLAALLSWGYIPANTLAAQQGATFTQLADLGSNIGISARTASRSSLRSRWTPSAATFRSSGPR